MKTAHCIPSDKGVIFIKCGFQRQQKYLNAFLLTDDLSQLSAVALTDNKQPHSLGRKAATDRAGTSLTITQQADKNLQWKNLVATLLRSGSRILEKILFDAIYNS